MRGKQSNSGGSGAKPVPPWLAGAAIGMTILSLASSAMVVGASLAVCGPPKRGG